MGLAYRAATPACAAAGNAAPTWCYNIPEETRRTTPECATAGNAVPSWCYTIPIGSRQYTPDCANADTRVAQWCYSIPVVGRNANPACVGAGSASIPPWTQHVACNVVPAFIRPLVGGILGCQYIFASCTKCF